MSNKSLKALSDYILISKYARYLPEKRRRATWKEQVEMMREMHLEKYKSTMTKELKQLIFETFDAIEKRKILGSQRALQYAGDPILKKENRQYNCTASYCDRPRFFQEAMYELLCGCGTGCSMQKHHVAKLPKVHKRINKIRSFIIPDSIEGWADALGELLNSYFKGTEIIKFDYKKIRPKGSLLSSGVGKAPGPEGLKMALDKIEKLMDGIVEETNILRPIHCLDILCYASDAVLSGGIRRSASLILFSPDDEEMLTAKTGNWFVENPQRARSNNSVLLLRDEVTKEQFGDIMKNVREFGEPGFVFSDSPDLLVNPCCISEDTIILTEQGPRKVCELVDTKFIAKVNGFSVPSLDFGFFKSGIKNLFKLETIEGFELELTEDHRVLTRNRGWIEAKHLNKSDEIVIHEHKNNMWPGFGNYNEGWLVGSLLGDGTFSGETAYLDYWGAESEYMPEYAISLIHKENLNTYQKITGGNCQPSKISKIKKKRLGSVGLQRLAAKVGITKTKIIGDEIYNASSDFISGFLSGWFDADGSIQGTQQKGISVRLTSTIFHNLQIAQRLLHYLGIYSKIYKRKPSGYYSLPNGRNGYSKYFCKSVFELVISNLDIVKFHNIVGFYNKEKSQKLFNLIKSYNRKPNQTKRIARFKSLSFIKTAEVYDCTIPKFHAFDANGMYVHNCEISLYGYDEVGNSGWGMCNLSEINGGKCDSEEKFYEACKYAAIAGTLQAGFTNFKYLTDISKKIVEREALIGVSITGVQDNPDILLSCKIQRKGAKIVREWNEKIAKLININPAARCTTLKPSGTASILLNTASGIHPHHAKRYFRRVQANATEEPLKFFKKANPRAVESSVWSNNSNDEVITFCIEVPAGAKTKNCVNALELLEMVKNTKKNWVDAGKNSERCIKPWLSANISNTINVKEHEWNDVINYIYNNRYSFTGISLLPHSGDKDYAQAPMCTVYTENEIARMYGPASMLASGLIVLAKEAFETLHEACDYILGLRQDKLAPIQKKLIESAKKFANRYFNNDLRKMTYCLKDVDNLKLWCDLERETITVDYSQMIEEEDNTKVNETIACAGGSCDVSHLFKKDNNLK